MSAKFQIQNSYHTILNHVRISGLNFSIQETPFSCYISVRKTKIKSPPVLDHEQSAFNFGADLEIEQIKARCQFLENANENLKHDYEVAIEELEEKTKQTIDLQSDKKKLIDELKELNGKIESTVAKKISLKR